jgi:hypothetical protein
MFLTQYRESTNSTIQPKPPNSSSAKTLILHLSYCCWEQVAVRLWILIVRLRTVQAEWTDKNPANRIGLFFASLTGKQPKKHG